MLIQASKHRPVGLLRQNLQQHGVRHPAVNEVRRVDAAFRGCSKRWEGEEKCRVSTLAGTYTNLGTLIAVVEVGAIYRIYMF